jgi:hypothetical protein
MDPAALAFTPEMTSEDVLSRVPFLARWAQLVRTGELEVHITPGTPEFLFDNNFFPAHPTVAAAIEAMGLRYRYAPEDVIRPVTTILNRAVTGLYCCVREEVHEEFSSTPSQPWHGNAALNSQSQRSVLLSRIEQLLHGSPGKIAFAAQPLNGEVLFSSVVSLVDPDDLPGLAAADLPKRINGSITAVDNLEDVLDCVSANEYWAIATDVLGIKFAIQLRCRERLKSFGNYHSFENLPIFYVGCDFYASLIGSQASGNGRYASVTLDACASAVLGLDSIKWHPFEKTSRTIDKALPLRAHLTESGAALRLMAWERSPGTSARSLEFANVGVKWEEEITSDDPAKAV